MFFPSQFPVFCLGIILYFAIAEKQSLMQISSKSLLVFSVLFMAYSRMFPNHILFAMAFFCLALAISEYRFVLFVNPVIRHIGKVSFSMYLVHFAVLHWLQYFNMVNLFCRGTFNFFAVFFITVSITTAISTLTYKLIEMPFQNVGKRVISLHQ